MWKTLLGCILFVLLSLSAAKGVPDQPPETQKQSQQQHKQAVEDQVVVPPFDLPEKEAVEMREKVQRLKPIIEKDRELSRMKIIDVEETPGMVPKVRLAHGYGSVLSLPFSFAAEDVAIGARDKFSIEVKDNSLVIFPLKEFKSTNLIVFEKANETSVPHHYLLVEDGASGEADFTVAMKRRDMFSVNSATDAMVRVITTQQLPEKGSAEDFLLEGRAPSLTKLDTYPFTRMMKLVKPDLWVFMVAGKVAPVGDVEFAVDLGNDTSVIASRRGDITVRRIADGKTFRYTP